MEMETLIPSLFLACLLFVQTNLEEDYEAGNEKWQAASSIAWTPGSTARK